MHKEDIGQDDRVVFLEGPPPGTLSPPIPWGWQQPERKRSVPSVPRQHLQQPKCRKRELLEKEPLPTVKRQRTPRVEMDSAQTPDSVCIYKLTSLVNIARITIFLPIYNSDSFVSRGHSPRSASTSKAGNPASRQTLTLPR